MVRSRLAASAVAALAIGSIALAPAPRSGAAAAGSIGFEVPSVVDPIHTNGEPDIAVDKFGRVFVSGPTGTGTQRSTWFGSVDGGHTYRVISPGRPSALTGIQDSPGGGDTDINFDRSGKQYFADLYALACLRTATTTDGGATVNQSIYPAGCAGLPGSDRQWLAVYDPAPGLTNLSAYAGPRPLIYLEYNNLNSGAQWNKSNQTVDGVQPGGPGLNYVDATTHAACIATTNQQTYAPFGADGYPSIDQVTGEVFQAAFGPVTNGKASILLNIGTPDVNGTLTFRDLPSATTPCDANAGLITVAANQVADAGDAANFVVSSMDTARNLYISWVGKSADPTKRQVYVSVASASSNWMSWSTVQVSSPPSLVGIFPWVKAGGPGRADVVWYGSNLSADPSDTTISQAADWHWDVFMSQVVFPVDAGGAPNGSPSVTQVKVTPHPMHYREICLAGSTCITGQGNRNLADFFDITVDKSGAAEIVYDDTSNGLIQAGFNTGNQQILDHAGAGVITVARQSSGPGLYLNTTPTGPPNTPVGGLRDVTGDALFPVIGGTNQPGMDILGSELRLQGNTLNVTMKVIDLANPAATITQLLKAVNPGTTNLQYVTRWQMKNTIYYAAMENTPLNQPSFYAGEAKSIDLCSVSACFPHVITYPEADPGFSGRTEPGTVNCPASPSASNPCSLTISVNITDVGNPDANSLLEEVGAYSFTAALRENAQNNGSAESDTVPLQIDGVCCYNFKASVQNGLPPPCHEGDGDGDVADGRGGKAHMHFDQDACEDGNPESIQANDSNTGDNFQSTNVTSVVFSDALSNVTIAGTGTHNGNPVTFTLVAVNGGAGIGAASLTLSDGYAVSGTLLAGSIQLQ
jgi:hypothetical protein